jgi:hypothetical protein
MTEVTAAAPLRIDAAQARDLLASDPALLGDEIGVDLRRGATIRQHVDVELSGPEQAPGGTRWTLTWVPVGHPTTLPAFEGVLEIRDEDDGATVLQVCGAYRAPLGLVGIIVDGVIGHRVAEASIEAFVASASRRLDRAAAHRQSQSWRGPERPADLRPA